MLVYCIKQNKPCMNLNYFATFRSCFKKHVFPYKIVHLNFLGLSFEKLKSRLKTAIPEAN